MCCLLLGCVEKQAQKEVILEKKTNIYSFPNRTERRRTDDWATNRTTEPSHQIGGPMWVNDRRTGPNRTEAAATETNRLASPSSAPIDQK